MAALLWAVGYALALAGAADAGRAYESFLLLLGYWIAPFLGVVVADAVRRRDRWDTRLFADRKHNPLAGVLAMIVGMAVSMQFWNQAMSHGPLSDAAPWLTDISSGVGFVAAAILYASQREWRASRRVDGTIVDVRAGAAPELQRQGS